ncbi:MAG: hypothetical protein K940chlam9_01450 [Chlamydiae bacterium]|nr:hypothetical protein [Chlamydiota bacterium]
MFTPSGHPAKEIDQAMLLNIWAHHLDQEKSPRMITDFLQEELISNAYFAFINKGRDRIKILYFDGDGLAIWQKRLEKGRFPKQKEQNPLMSRRSFLMLIEGVIPKRVYKRFNLFFSMEKW